MGRLQRTDLPAISDLACRATYSDSHYWEWLKEDMICAGDLVWIRIKHSFSFFFFEKVTPSMGPCNGDSGGGLMNGSQVICFLLHLFPDCGHH